MASRPTRSRGGMRGRGMMARGGTAAPSSSPAPPAHVPSSSVSSSSSSSSSTSPSSSSSSLPSRGGYRGRGGRGRGAAASSAHLDEDLEDELVETRIGAFHLIVPAHLRKYVVHCRRSNFDVYCGRRNPLFPADDYPWGNPIKMQVEEDRARVTREFAVWASERPDFIARAKAELRGKVLACWCAPKMCHCNILAQIANSP